MKFFLYTLVLLILICANGVAHAENYKLSILPRFFPEKLTAMMTPLAEYLSHETGANIQSVLTDNFAAYETTILKGDIQIGYQNPLVYVNISDSHEAIVTALKGEGGSKFRGIIIARPDSGLTGIADLKGKKIMIVSKTSAGGFLSQKLSLREKGFDISRNLEIVEAADNRQENVIISVSIGDVDAGFIRESALHKADEFIMPGSIKPIAATEWLPNWALSVNKNMPQQMKDSIKNALLSLPAEGSVLQAIGLKGFKPAHNSDYDIIRDLIN